MAGESDGFELRDIALKFETYEAYLDSHISGEGAAHPHCWRGCVAGGGGVRLHVFG
jgi:hypothetical protein